MNKLAKASQKFKALYVGPYAVVTNTITAGALGCLADSIAQVAENATAEKSRKWDFARTQNMTVVCTVFGPLVHYWYRFLDNKFPGKASRAVLKKVAIDLIVAPVYYGLYIAGLCVLKNRSLEGSFDEYKEKAPLLIAADLVLWPFLQTFNFVFFPPHYRIIGLKINEILLGVIASHLVNNDYSMEKLKSRYFSKSKSDE